MRINCYACGKFVRKNHHIVQYFPNPKVEPNIFCHRHSKIEFEGILRVSAMPTYSISIGGYRR